MQFHSGHVGAIAIDERLSYGPMPRYTCDEGIMVRRAVPARSRQADARRVVAASGTLCTALVG